MHAGCLGSPQDRAKVVGIFDTVENDQKGWLAAKTGPLENLLRTAVGLGSNKGNDTLMPSTRHQPVKRRWRFDMNRNVLGFGLLNDFRKLAIGSLNKETLKGASAGPQRLSDGMQPVEQLRLISASS